MQETKRRGKKGVILLALMVALLVMAIVPAVASAALLNVGTDSTLTGPDYSATRAVSLKLDVTAVAPALITRYEWSVDGGATWSTPVTVVPIAHLVVNPLVVTLRDIGDGWQTVTVRVSDSTPEYTDLTWQVFLSRTKPITKLTLTYPGNPGDHPSWLPSLNWYNGDWQGFTVDLNPAAPNNIPMGTTFWQISSITAPWKLPAVFQGADSEPWPATNQAPPQDFTLWTAEDPDAIYEVVAWSISAAGVKGDVKTYYLGKDTEHPEISVTPVVNLGLEPWQAGENDTPVWHNADYKVHIVMSDPGGSGMGVNQELSPYWELYASNNAFIDDGKLKASAWDPYTLSADVTIPATSFSSPTGLPTESHPELYVEGYDNAGNYEDGYFYPNIDVTPPSTDIKSSAPAGAYGQMTGTWTNQDVTLNLVASDAGGNGSLAYSQGKFAGVDYAEYKIDTATSTAPTAGTKVTPDKYGDFTIKITQSSPVAGPVKVWYRSVDKSVPGGNKEAWQWTYVFIDKVAPVMSNDYPTYETLGAALAKAVSTDYKGWWMNSSFGVHLYADDLNSGLMPTGGIQWRLGTWYPGWYYLGVDEELWVHLSNDLLDADWPTDSIQLNDGIYPLDYKATDRAGNEASATVKLQIDTRGPNTDGVTYGADHWIDGTKPFVLTATDQAVGAGVAATLYRVDQQTPYTANVATTVGTTLDTSVKAFAGAATGDVHTIDFASVDNARPRWWSAAEEDGFWYGNWEGNPGLSVRGPHAVPVWKSLSVKLDVTAPVVTAMDPKLGEWQNGPATVNFSGTDVGSGYAYTEWKTSGTDWTKGEVAQVGGNGEITVTYHGVDKVGLKSADQTMVVKVVSTPPTVTAKSASVKTGHKATFKFTVTSVTPTAQVFIQIRTKSGHTLSVHSYNNVTTGSEQSRSFMVNLKKGKYNIRIGAVDEAGNVQTRRGTGTLTVK